MFDRGDRLIYMKVGTHAQEPLSAIIERKKREIDEAGFALWGYGGPTCHPQKVVQPFADDARGGPIILAMHEMDSKHFAEPVRADEYSADGVNYHEIHPEVHVRGSRYALWLRSLEVVEATIDLSRTRVALGNSKGKPGNTYIQGRVDKACLEVVDEPAGESKTTSIALAAELEAPYAVFLRNRT